MCNGFLNSWRPPVVCGFLVAFAFIPFGIDLTFEAYKDGPPISIINGGNSTSSDIAKAYEGPALISTGVLFAIVGMILGCKGYKRQKELEAEAKLRAEREAFELEQLKQGPPLEFMPQSQIEKPSQQGQCQDPETANLAQSSPTPSPEPLTAISSVTSHIEVENGSNLDERDLPDRTGRWIASMSDLSTVGEEVSGEADNFGFESDEAKEKKSPQRDPSSTEITITNESVKEVVQGGRTRLEGAQLNIGGKSEIQREKVSSKMTPRMQENIKSSSRGNASSNKNRNSQGREISSSVKFEDEFLPQKLLTRSNEKPVAKSSKDQRRRRRDRTSNGSSSDHNVSPRWGMELLSSSAKQSDEQPARGHMRKTQQYKDSGYYDNEADLDDIHPTNRPSAPNPGHRRNTRDKSKAAASKQPRKEPRNYSYRSSTNVDYLEGDRYYHEHRNYRERYRDNRTAYDDRYGVSTEGGDSVFYDSPEFRRHYQQHEPSAVVDGKGRPQAGQSSKATAQTFTERHYSESSKGVLLNARTLELKQHRRSSSNPSQLPTVSRHRGSENDRKKRPSSGSPRSKVEDRITTRRRGDITSRDTEMRRQRRTLPTPPQGDQSRRHRVRSDGSITQRSRRANADEYTRQQSTTSDVTSNKSKYYDEEISA